MNFIFISYSIAAAGADVFPFLAAQQIRSLVELYLSPAARLYTTICGRETIPRVGEERTNEQRRRRRRLQENLLVHEI